MQYCQKIVQSFEQVSDADIFREMPTNVHFLRNAFFLFSSKQHFFLHIMKSTCFYLRYVCHDQKLQQKAETISPSDGLFSMYYIVAFPTGRDSATFRDNGTEVLSLSRDKGTTGQAQNLATGRDGILTACPVPGRPAGQTTFYFAY